MLKRRRPHPRSLDALFPRPRVRIRRCINGHGQSPAWIPGSVCRACEADGARQASSSTAKAAAVADREAWSAANGRPGPHFLMGPTREGRIIKFSIPPWAQALRKKQGRQRARRPRGRRI